MGVLLIHALLVLTFALSLSLPAPRRPNTTGVGATALVSSAEPDMTVVFIDEPTPTDNAAPPKPPALASRGTAPPDLQLVVLSPDPSPAAASEKTADSDEAAEDTVSVGAAEHARLYGRYLGQVQARIERAWTRPRSEIGASRFSCRARIRQDRRGVVIEVTLDPCNGTERWQQSLVSAIRTASPVPAPPDASVYADILWLSFSSEGFEEGRSTQGFEPETRAAGGTERNVLESFQRFTSGTPGGHRSDDKA
ncbi:MAG TPA: cell envelope integrity protein TolA, partial [Steroidobacteraceae bacterium]|nr:cell envelope integrity protein TolA [Steroidobacteraceae bacterium]